MRAVVPVFALCVAGGCAPHEQAIVHLARIENRDGQRVYVVEASYDAPGVGNSGHFRFVVPLDPKLPVLQSETDIRRSIGGGTIEIVHHRIDRVVR